MDILETVKKSAKKHYELANVYEAGGNAAGAAQLRAVSNLLYAIADGREPETVLPGVSGVFAVASSPKTERKR